MGARLYNPATGRFLSVDPVVEGSANRYLYPTDPINSFDLDGKLWWFAVAVAVRVCVRYCVRAARGIYTAVRASKMRKKHHRVANRKKRKHETTISIIGRRKGIVFKIEWRGASGRRYFLRLTRPHGHHKKYHWVGGYMVKRKNKWDEEITFHRTFWMRKMGKSKGSSGRTSPGPQP
jgi:hypothetical protein